MIRLKNIRPLSEFQRHTKAQIEGLKKSGEPTVLTVNGQAEVVVMSAEAFQALIEAHEELKAVNAVHKGVLEARQGKGVSAEEAFDRLARKLPTRRRRKAS